jgi:phosphatidylinositol alpha-mannosyltransferase
MLRRVRIALVSPYSWTYPGGVTRHIEALAGEFLGRGHEVRVLAPYDPDDRFASITHRGARPQPRELPEWLVPVGRTVGFPANGAVSNLATSPTGVSRLRSELVRGDFDVVHIHEPVVPTLSWDATAFTRAPLVGTFHTFGENPVTHGIAVGMGARRRMNRLHVRIAVSEAAAWTGRRFFGGHYRIVPNGVAVPDLLPAKPGGEALRILFVGQAVDRKGLPILLRAFEALREHVPATLRIVGAAREEVEPMLLSHDGVEVLGKVSDAEKEAELAAADVLAAPSLGGESFGMVLTEAFAHGTPVVASDIAGYRDVVRDGRDGLLVPRGDAAALAGALLDLHEDPARRRELGAWARERAHRFAWPTVAGEVLEAYEEARERAAATVGVTVPQRVALDVGATPADGAPRTPARRLPSPEPPLAGGRRRPVLSILRKLGTFVAALAGLYLAYAALQRIGIDKIGRSLLDSSPAWVLTGLGLMCASMAVRAVAWHQILKAALPRARVKLSDALQGTFIGVLMSATLPARLGEPSRALIVARRTGRPRDNLPAILGTIVSQTALNLVALLILGAVMLGSVDFFHGHQRALIAVSTIPLVLLIVVVIAPAFFRRGALPQVRTALARVRSGLAVFRQPRRAGIATVAQLSAWAIQWLACYVLLVALGLDGQAGIGAAAAVLFAVNVTAAVPATPSNLGVFQAACVAVLHGAFGVSSADALGYGIVLQAVEIATAVIMGAPALVKEGVSWKDVKLRAMHTSPVQLPAREPAAERSGRVEVKA